MRNTASTEALNFKGGDLQRSVFMSFVLGGASYNSECVQLCSTGLQMRQLSAGSAAHKDSLICPGSLPVQFLSW